MASEIVLPVTSPETEWIGDRTVAKVNPTREHLRLQSEMTIALSTWARGRGEVGTEWQFRVAPPGEARRPLISDVAFVWRERLRGHSREELESPAFAPNTNKEMLSSGRRSMF